MTLKLSDLHKIWGLSEGPLFGDIWRKEDGELGDLFKFREGLVEETIDRLDNLMTCLAIFVVGYPGVGKTTFFHYLKRFHFGDRMTIIGFSERLRKAEASGYSRLDEHQVLCALAGVESFLNEILRKNNECGEADKSAINDMIEKYSEVKSRLSSDHIFDAVKDSLLEKCQNISRYSAGVDQHYLVFDDVDYIYPEDQVQLISLICDMVNLTENPLILYSARPEAAGIAMNHIKSRLSHFFSGEPIFVNKLDAYDVVVSRFEHRYIDHEISVNPFGQEQKKLRSAYNYLSNGNIRNALDMANSAVLRARSDEKLLLGSRKQFSEETFIRALYGEPSSTPWSKRDIHNIRHIPNAFRAVSPDDPVPLDYVTLRCFTKPRVVDESLFLDFNKIAHSLSPKEVSNPEQSRHFKDDDIIAYIHAAHTHDLIQRIDKVSYGTHSSSQVFGDFKELTNDKTFCLQPRSMYLWSLMGQKNYQKLTSLRKWRAGIVDYILRNLNTNIVTVEDQEIFEMLAE